MDRINKTINIDNSRSHRKGLLPFVRYGGNTIEPVTSADTNGNYGHYVCDFCIFSGDGETVVEKERMKYLDVIRRYNFIHKFVKNGVCVKKINVKETTFTKINCGDKEASSPEVNVEKQTETVVRFTKNFNTYTEEIDSNGEPKIVIKSDSDNLLSYDYVPLDANLFSTEGKLYSFNGEAEYEFLKTITSDMDEVPLEYLTKLEKLEKHLNLIETNDFFIFIENYDNVMKMNDLWEEWWVTNFKSDGKWRENIFDGYDGKDYHLSFYADVNKYIIGEIEVPTKYSDELVPSYINNSDYYNYKEWFEINSAITVDAYLSTTTENEWIIENWEKRGGGDFYDFLVENPPLWQSIKNGVNGDNGVYFSYSAPIIEINTIINADMDYETMYNVYEYNAENNEFTGAINPFYSDNINDIMYVNYAYNETNGVIERVNKYYFKNSIDTIKINDIEYVKITSSSTVANGLTKQWVEFNDENSYGNCESQIRTLSHPLSVMVSDNIYGTYKVYDENEPENGQLFKCTFCSGWSTSARVETHCVTTKITYDDDGNEILSEEYISNGSLVSIDDEIQPYTSSEDVYQVIGNKVIGTSAGTEEERVIIADGYESYTYEKVWYNYSWWECVKVSKEELNTKECADGEIITKLNTDTKYRNTTILSCIENIIGACDYGDYFYILSRYDNGNTEIGKNPINKISVIKTIDPPYKPEVILKLNDEGEVVKTTTTLDVRVNVNTYEDGTIVYDKVFSIDYTNKDSAIVKYAKGITYGDNEETSGIHYEEILPYKLNKKAKIPVDGVYVAEIYYDELDVDSNKISVVSEEYRLSRLTNIARITGMEVGTQWNEKGAVNALLITKDGSEGLQEEPRYNINLLFNRGNAAANESHFKLSECNSLEDLENYGNNFFNI